MNYDISTLNHSKYYYFIDDNNQIIEVDKNKNDWELEQFKLKYFYHNGSKVFNILFGKDGDTSKNSFFKFLILDFGKTNENTKSQIISLFNDLLDNCDVIELKGKVVIVYYQDLDLDFNSILNSINLDFFTVINMFNSGRIYYYQPTSFSTLFEFFVGASNLYNSTHMASSSNNMIIPSVTGDQPFEWEYSSDHKGISFYCNYINLVLLLVKIKPHALKLIRPIILNRVTNDSYSEKIIYSMLNNNLNVSNAAKDLYMHRNTLNNKIEYIKSETGLNIQKFKDAMAIYWLINTK